MKSASSGTLAALSSGVTCIVNLWKFTLSGGTVVAFHSSDYTLPITVASGDAAATYQPGLLIRRGALKQRVGLEADALDITLTPQPDYSGAPILIGGVPLLQAVRRGVLDGAAVLYSRMLLSSFSDLSPGATVWWLGKVSTANADRQSASLRARSALAALNVQMPRNVVQTGCGHTLYGSGCGVSKASFTTTGTVTSSSVNNALNSSLAAADGYYSLGVITFTSGLNAGQSRTVKRSLNASGYVELVAPLPTVPQAGDTFSVVPGCDKTKTTCSSKFSNLARFRGFPYVPVPETLYDGGASVPMTTVDPSAIVGSPWGFRLPGTYQP